MTNEKEVSVRDPSRRLINIFAERYSVDPDKLLDTLKATCFKTDNGVTNAEMMALLVVADQYGLNPFTRQIFAFPDKKAGIVPIVGVDGWSAIINGRPELDGIEFTHSENIIESAEHKPCPEWIECHIYRKDRSRPTTIRERFHECYVPPRVSKSKYDAGEYTTIGPWQTHTSRQLRHKALIQCARVSFSLTGIYDEDEASRIIDVYPEKTAPVVKPPEPAKKNGMKALDAFAPTQELPEQPLPKQEPVEHRELSDEDFEEVRTSSREAPTTMENDHGERHADTDRGT